MGALVTTTDWFDERLGNLEANGLVRSLGPIEPIDAVHVRAGGRQLSLFSGNDYLGLSTHPAVKYAAIQAIERYGMGPRGSPLICGYSELHEALEGELAALLGGEAALLFPTGYAANLASIAALADGWTAIFSDQLNHASIIDGCRLARENGAETIVYRHADPVDLEFKLASHPGRKLIVTESVFSMDGDVAPLGVIAELADKYAAALMVDESHATLVFGQHGAGLCSTLGVVADLRVGTLSKAIGVQGGFVVTSQRIKRWLLNRGRAYVFSSAAPIPMIAAAREALRIGASQPELRSALWLRAATIGAESPILPVVLGSPQAVMRAQRELFELGYHVIGVRPPTVPDGTARLRVTVSAMHPLQEVRALREIISAGRRRWC